MEDKVLSKPQFMIYPSSSNSSHYSEDPLRMMAEHLYRNPIVHKQAAELANDFIGLCDYQVLILIDKVEQFKYLLPYLKYELGFAHSGVTAGNRVFIDERYHKSDPTALIQSFNDKKLKLLVGTGILGIGTDMPHINAIINLQGGKSEVKFKQSVGRGTRRPLGKDSFYYIDFDIQNCQILHRHLVERVKIYRTIFDNVKIVA